MNAAAPSQVLADLWRAAGQPAAALDAVSLTGAEPVLPSSFAVGTAAQATVAASALAAAELWRLRTGRQQRVSVDMRHAGDRVPQRAVSRSRRQAGPRASRQDRRPLPLRRRPLGAAAHQPAASPRRHAQAAAARLRPRSGAARAGRVEGLRRWRTPPPRPASSSRRRDRSRNGMRIRRAGRWRGCRCSPSSASATRPPQPLPAGDRPLGRRQGAGPDARDRRPGVRPHARGRTAPTC